MATKPRQDQRLTPLRYTAETLLGTTAAIAGIGAASALLNRLTARRLPTGPAAVIEPVVVAVPARDEAARLPDLIADLRAQHGVSRMRVWILDDGSTDGTFPSAVTAIGDDDRFTVVAADSDPAPGWTGKTSACARLAEIAGITADSASTPAGVLIFLDADVRLRPTAIAAAVGELRRTGAGLVSPWPYQRAGTLAEALIQPLLCWTWSSTLPVRLADRGTRPSMAVACGQFLTFDAAAYRAAGGHAAVAGQITEDLALARAVRRTGRRTSVVAAGPLASTRMYRGAAEVEAGYTRWLWSAYGSVAAAVAVDTVTALTYLLPPLAAAFGTGRVRRRGVAGYGFGVASRLLARSLESGSWPQPADVLAALAHPISIAAYLRLSTRSRRLYRRDALRWKGRPIPIDPRTLPVAAALVTEPR